MAGMSELDCQTLMVKSVRQFKGFAFKLSNRFLKGVPDLYVKLPVQDPWFWEVKLRRTFWKYPNKGYFKPDLTPLQHKFLKEHETAGGNSGVATFVRGQAELMVILIRYRVLIAEGGQVELGWARPLKRGKREEKMYELLENFK